MLILKPVIHICHNAYNLSTYDSIAIFNSFRQTMTIYKIYLPAMLHMAVAAYSFACSGLNSARIVCFDLAQTRPEQGFSEKAPNVT